jgi:hypothetical protein
MASASAMPMCAPLAPPHQPPAGWKVNVDATIQRLQAELAGSQARLTMASASAIFRAQRMHTLFWFFAFGHLDRVYAAHVWH